MHREAGREADYFATSNRTEEWAMGGRTALRASGPAAPSIKTPSPRPASEAVISEPAPAPDARELFTDELAPKSRFESILFYVLQSG